MKNRIKLSLVKNHFLRIEKTELLVEGGKIDYQYRVITKEHLEDLKGVCPKCKITHDNPDEGYASPDRPRRKAVRWYYGHGVRSIIQRRKCKKRYNPGKASLAQGIDASSVEMSPLEEEWKDFETIDEKTYKKYKSKYIKD